MHVVEEFNDKNVVLKIVADENPTDPRDWDNVGKMVCWHKRYSLGDKHDFDDPDAFMEWWEEKHPEGELLPLYLYDHSGITMSTAPYS